MKISTITTSSLLLAALGTAMTGTAQAEHRYSGMHMGGHGNYCPQQYGYHDRGYNHHDHGHHHGWYRKALKRHYRQHRKFAARHHDRHDHGHGHGHGHDEHGGHGDHEQRHDDHHGRGRHRS